MNNEDSKVLEFGDRVSTTEVFKRITTQKKTKYRDHQRYKKWVAESRNIESGVFLGYRYLKNGPTWFDEYGYVFKEDEQIKAALVAPNSKEKAVYVPINSVVVLKE